MKYLYEGACSGLHEEPTVGTVDPGILSHEICDFCPRAV